MIRLSRPTVYKLKSENKAMKAGNILWLTFKVSQKALVCPRPVFTSIFWKINFSNKWAPGLRGQVPDQVQYITKQRGLQRGDYRETHSLKLLFLDSSFSVSWISLTSTPEKVSSASGWHNSSSGSHIMDQWLSMHPALISFPSDIRILVISENLKIISEN